MHIAKRATLDPKTTHRRRDRSAPLAERYVANSATTAIKTETAIAVGHAKPTSEIELKRRNWSVAQVASAASGTIQATQMRSAMNRQFCARPDGKRSAKTSSPIMPTKKSTVPAT